MTGAWAELLTKNFTRLPHLITRVWWRQITSTEKDLVIAIWDATAGWGRPEAEITIEDLMTATGLSKPTVVKGLRMMRERGIAERRQHQVGTRGHTYRWRLVPRGTLQALAVQPAVAKQRGLPFNVQKISTAPAPTAPPTELRIFTGTELKSLTPSQPGLRSVKNRSRSNINTHQAHPSLYPVENAVENGTGAAAPRVRVAGSKRVPQPHKSRHDKSTIRLYAEVQQAETLRWNRNHESKYQRDGIRNVGGWTTAAYRSGEHDDEIDTWLASTEAQQWLAS